MESIYDPENVHATEPLDLKAYFEEFRQICSLQNIPVGGDEERLNLVKEMDLDDNLSVEDINSLEDLCSINKLHLVDETDSLPIPQPEKLTTKTELETVQPITEAARTLETVKCKERNETRARFDVNLGSKKLIRDGQFQNDAVNNLSIAPRDKLQPGSTFIYYMNVYKPFVLNYVQRNSSENLRFAYQIEALGINTLEQVADNIKCMSDEAIIKEVENTKVDLQPYINAKKQYPSRFFFIGDCFYNDFRDPKAIDLSCTAKKWLKEKNIADCKSSDMLLIRLDMLHPRLGYPYVYVHQGNCEHIFAFSDAKMLQNNDCLDRTKYPRISFSKRETNLTCCMCSSVHSKWMIFNSDKLPQKKMFMCTECCDSYLYLDGKKVGSFQLFPYFDSELIGHTNYILD